MFILSSPLEQFQILPLIPVRLGDFDISFTNASLIIILGLLLTVFVMFLLMENDTSAQIVPNRYQVFFETFYEMITEMLESNIGKKGQQYFPFVFILFTFILVSNLIGLVPYSFTITSHLVVTLFLSTTVFVAVNIILFRNHGLHGWSLFLPPGTSLGLVPILVPIELVSHFFKVISLAVRLFANMMAGHTLLKVIAGFAWSMMVGGYFFAHFVPLATLFLLVGLELAVAMIQAYVFTILTCIYLNDAVNLH
jgi:ATP synthase subunit 6